MSAESYLSRGVSPTKDDVKKAVANQSGGVFPVRSANSSKIYGDENYCMAIHADGAGTSPPSVISSIWRPEIRRFSLVGTGFTGHEYDDLACIGAINDFSLSNTTVEMLSCEWRCIAKVIDGYNRVVDTLSRMG